MVNAGRIYLRTSPHIATLPSLAVFAIALATNVLGDVVRDALDPRMRQLV